MISAVKKNKTNLFLILTVAVIWAIVLFKLVKRAPEKEEIKNKEKQAVAQITIEPPVQYTISTYDRDPFLGTPTVKKTFQKRNTTAQPIWPVIDYLGQMNAADSKEEFHFFKINGKTKIWSLNEMHNGMTLLKSNREVLIHYKGEQKKFKRLE